MMCRRSTIFCCVLLLVSMGLVLLQHSKPKRGNPLRTPAPTIQLLTPPHHNLQPPRLKQRARLLGLQRSNRQAQLRLKPLLNTQQPAAQQHRHNPIPKPWTSLTVQQARVPHLHPLKQQCRKSQPQQNKAQHKSAHLSNQLTQLRVLIQQQPQ